MLSQLTIKNFGLIDNLSLELDAKLNCLTGETGAGKSIIIDALRIVLGERFSSSFIRDAQKPSSLEAVFESLPPELKSVEILKDYFEEDDSLIMQRTFQPDGRSKIKINGATVPLSHLKQVGNLLIDFHGPHDHQMLLSSDYHLGMLDALVNFNSDLVNYTKCFETYRETKRKLLELSAVGQTRNREIDMLKFQVKELEQISLEEKDYQENVINQAKVDNMEKLNESTAQILNSLSNNDGNIDAKISDLFAPMNILLSSDESTKNMMDLLTQFQELSGQLQSDIRSYADG
ncbi:DNA repair protein RecN, partial [hydrothermal vent metagenome]